MRLIGRQNEIEVLKRAYESNRPELITVYGRRRIGKTFLIRNVFKGKIVFEITGINKVTLSKQLLNFYLTLSEKQRNIRKPKNWIEAFDIFKQYLDKLNSKNKKVIFFDEFPWMDTKKSDFLPAFEHFWNSFANKRNDLLVIICGSSSSYIVKRIIRSKGGLHNRLTGKIRLLPFNLCEAEKLLKQDRVRLSRVDIIRLYMILGGIPYYLEKILPGESLQQIVDRLYFQKDGFLRTEFRDVFEALFERHDNHESIIRTLTSVRKGITRDEIIKRTKIGSGGTVSKTLEELEESGFIEKYMPYQGRKKALYRLTDEYSMFYLKYIEKSKPSSSGTWNKISGQQSFKVWLGFSFETLCIKHIEQIKEGLKISGINSTSGSWLSKGKGEGAQIDLLIDRDDNVINICEIKFYRTRYSIDKKYSEDILRKIDLFTRETRTRKNIFITFITSNGLNQNKYSRQIVQNELIADHLFIDL